MSIEIKSLIGNKLGEDLYKKILRYESEGAYWVIYDEGLKLLSRQKSLLLLVRATSIMK